MYSFAAVALVVFGTLFSSAAAEPELQCAKSSRVSDGPAVEAVSLEQAAGMVLLQVSHHVPKLDDTEVIQDTVLDEDFPQDDQPVPTRTAAPNVSANASSVTAAPNGSAMQINRRIAAGPTTTTAPPAVPGNKSTPANTTDAAGDSTTTAPASTTNLTNATGAAKSTGCATRKDPRAEAWFATTSPEGTPCVFGADDRDEGSHCIEEYEYGSNGWCFTAADRSTWGSCNERCPLYGASAKIEKRIDSVSKQVQGIAKHLGVKVNSSVSEATSQTTTGAPKAAASATKDAPSKGGAAKDKKDK